MLVRSLFCVFLTTCYWYGLYNTNYAYSFSVFSIALFGLLSLTHAVDVTILLYKVLIGINIARNALNPPSLIANLFKKIFTFLTSICGLLLSVELFMSGADLCFLGRPAGVDKCRLLIVLFGMKIIRIKMELHFDLGTEQSTEVTNLENQPELSDPSISINVEL